MIRSLEVKGLNNRLSDKFKFHEDLNIFTGPNGSCKTTLLKLIWYFISGNLQQIVLEIPFHTVSIQTDLLINSLLVKNRCLVFFVTTHLAKAQLFSLMNRS